MTVIRQQRGISLTRLALACCTLGFSLPWFGIRRVRRTTVNE